MAKKMHFAVILPHCPMHHSVGSWRLPRSLVGYDYARPPFWQDVARILERGKFDMLFLADAIGVSDRYGQSIETTIRYGVQCPIHDATPLIPLMATVTKRLGLAVTRIGWIARRRRCLSSWPNGWMTLDLMSPCSTPRWGCCRRILKMKKCAALPVARSTCFTWIRSASTPREGRITRHPNSVRYKSCLDAKKSTRLATRRLLTRQVRTQPRWGCWSRLCSPRVVPTLGCVASSRWDEEQLAPPSAHVPGPLWPWPEGPADNPKGIAPSSPGLGQPWGRMASCPCNPIGVAPSAHMRTPWQKGPFGSGRATEPPRR